MSFALLVSALLLSLQTTVSAQGNTSPNPAAVTKACSELLTTDTTTISAVCKDIKPTLNSTSVEAVARNKANLDVFCNQDCSSAIDKFAKDLSSTTCANATFESLSATNGTRAGPSINSTLLGSALHIMSKRICTREKKDNQYCLINTTTDILPMVNGTTTNGTTTLLSIMRPLIIDGSSPVCSTCFETARNATYELFRLGDSVSSYVSGIAYPKIGCVDDPQSGSPSSVSGLYVLLSMTTMFFYLSL